MKKIVLFIFIMLLVAKRSDAQINHIIDGRPYDSTIIRFTTDSIPDFIPDTSSTPLWEMGNTNKPFFAPDGYAVKAIMTDTFNHYRINANNWFTLKIHNGQNPIVDFWHRYETDSGQDGGIVEFSLDTGITWQNIKGRCNTDSFGFTEGVVTTNFYSFSDTLQTGEPAFTGTKNSLQYSRFQFFHGVPFRATSGSGCSFGNWEHPFIWIRFRFVSDSIADTLAGWIIDSIKIEQDYYGSGVKQVSGQSLPVYPTPSYDGHFIFPELENERRYKIDVYNAIGARIMQLPYSHSLDLSRYAKGLYVYKVADGTAYYSGRLLIE